jgi:hypothetical protein
VTLIYCIIVFELACSVNAKALEAIAKKAEMHKTAKMALKKAFCWDMFYVFIYTQKDSAPLWSLIRYHYKSFLQLTKENFPQADWKTCAMLILSYVLHESSTNVEKIYSFDSNFLDPRGDCERPLAQCLWPS